MLLNEIKLQEAQIETKLAEDVWSDNASDAKEYRNATLYAVRQVDGSNPAKFEAFKVIGDKRKPFGTFTAVELRTALTPLRANQKPDVEGYTTYVDPEKVEAFQYSGETINIDLDGSGDTSRLSRGDYLVRSIEGKNFVFSIEKQADFEATLTPV